ncbi:hypothetical protein MRBLRH13_000247 [Agrobacterium radiobacter]|uniref:hypothetical protein n=1 Tax=Agrobacterium radiobacter TaxID=362 RepID=UPI0034193215
MNELEEILSGDSNAAPVDTTTTTERTRDEAGRFAAQTDTQPPVTQTTADADATDHPDDVAQHQNGVPVRAVKDEREKRQAAQAEAEQLRREMAELKGQITLLSQQRQPAPPPQQEQQPVSLWDDPESYLKGQLSPVQQQLEEVREMILENQASQVHGAEKLQAAKSAAEALDQAGKANLHRQLMAGGNPFDNLVKWHQQQETMKRVGDDPDAWLQAELEKRLSDPAEQAKILERIRSGAAANTSRSQPTTALPPSLSRLPAGGNAAIDSDASDAALFSHATR